MLNKIASFFRSAYWPMFFIPVGLVMTVFGIFAFKAVDRIKGFPETEAVVTRIELYEDATVDDEGNRTEATYTVYLKYTVEGKEYENEYGVFSGYKAGDTVKICYNPEDPDDIAQPNGIGLPIGLLAAGLASITGGIIATVVAVKKHKKLKEQEKEWENGN